MPSKFQISKVFLLGIVMAVPSAARGHDMWVAEENSPNRKRDLLVVRQYVGHDSRIEQTLPFRSEAISRLELITPYGVRNLRERLTPGGLSALQLQPDFEGIGLLCMERDFVEIELSAAQFRAHLDHEELSEIRELWKKKNPDSTQRERYRRIMKCLFQVGGAVPSQTRYRPLQDRHLRFLANVPGVTALDLRGSEISDSGLSHLSAMDNLQSLDLSDTSISDAGLVHLQTLPLQYLNLAGSNVTSKGVALLNQSGTLRVLEVAELGFSDDEVAKSQQTQQFKINNKRENLIHRLPSLQPRSSQLDLRLLQDPYLLEPGQAFHVQLRFDGLPIPNKSIWAFARQDDRIIQLKASTNENGIAEFPLETGGAWLIRLTHMLPSKAEGAEWESYWAAFTFLLPNRE